ncbi:hypothetical protein [Nocardioides sp. LHG3406-4]|uniref:hypothetical protein n=1 Tax=Nocardioides sp. LHG3406-4 TaxID=2804575 RepID=UPI003CF72427
MPDLPTITVTPDQATRLLAAFADTTDPVTGEPLTPAQAYKLWLRDQLVRYVLAQEGVRLDQAAAVIRRQTLDQLAADLSPRST